MGAALFVALQRGLSKNEAVCSVTAEKGVCDRRHRTQSPILPRERHALSNPDLSAVSADGFAF